MKPVEPSVRVAQHMAQGNRTLRTLGIILGVLLVLFAVAVAVAGPIVLSRVRAATATYSAQIGRPIVIGGLSIQFLSGFGFAVDKVEVGAAAGEDRPLVDVEKVSVKVRLLKTLFSGGKHVDIRSAEVQGLTVNVLRLKDGTTNLERLQRKLEETSKRERAEEPSTSAPSELSRLRLQHVALRNGLVRFRDERAPQAHELAISKLDAVVDGIEVGRPLEVKVSAAVLTAEENFKLTLKTTELNSAFQATPQSLVLKVSPVDLGPLGPFLPKSLGLEAGKVDADLDVRLGALVPGGSGETTLAGVFHARGLKFADAKGGKALDAKGSLDLRGDVARGDVNIQKLELDLGPAGIRGKGAVKDLRTARPSFQGLEITGHDLDPAALSAYYPPLHKLLGGEVAGPAGLRVRASGTEAAPSLQVELDLTPLRLAIPSQLTKAAGAPMRVTARLHGGAGDGALRFSADAELSGADLRPGGSLNKPPGQPFEIRFVGTYKSTRGRGSSTTDLELTRLDVHVLADSFTAMGSVHETTKGQASTRRFELTASGAHLDLDKLLLPSERGATKTRSPPQTAADYAGLGGHAAVKLGALVAKNVELKDVVLDLNVHDDLVTLSTVTAGLYGGKVDASGTTLHLSEERAPFELKAKMEKVDVGQLLTRRSGGKKTLGGSLGCSAQLSGARGEGVDIAKTLTGTVQGALSDGVFYGADLVAGVAGPLGQALPLGSKKPSSSGTTPLGKEIPFAAELKNGVALLKRPISITLPEAKLDFEGGIHLDGELALAGTVGLQPATISSLTGGKVVPQGPIPVALKLTGPAWAPSISGMDLRPAVDALIKLEAASAAKQLFGGTGGAGQQPGGPQKQNADQGNKDEAERLRREAEQKAADALKNLLGK
jgi:AsmA protein